MTADQLITTTAYLFQVDRAALLGRSRVARIAEARQALAWALRQSDWTLEAIGELLDRDHTTIIYAIDRIDRKARHNPPFAARLQALTAQAQEPPQPPATLRDRVAELEARIATLEAMVQR